MYRTSIHDTGGMMRSDKRKAKEKREQRPTVVRIDEIYYDRDGMWTIVREPEA